MRISTIGLLFIVGAVSAVAGEDQIERRMEWPLLEQQLAQVPLDAAILERFRKLEPIKDVIERRDSGFCKEMATQVDRPLLRIAGLAAAGAFDKKLATEIAVAIAIRPHGAPRILIGPAYVHIAEEVQAADVMTHISNVLAYDDGGDSNAILCIGAINYDAAHDWFHSPPARSASYTVRAMLLDRLLSEAPPGRLPTDAMKEFLRSCSRVPGMPRVVYCLQKSVHGADVSQELSSVLADESVSDLSIHLLVRRNPDAVRKLMVDEKLILAPKRRDFINSLLNDASDTEKE